jgi:phage shock protein A
MEEYIALDDRQLQLLAYEQQQHEAKHNQLTQSLTDLDEKLTLCFKSNKDDLARSLLKRKLETQQTLKLLTEKITRLKEKVARLTSRLTEHQTQLADMKQKAEIFMAGEQVNSNNWENPLATIREEDVEIAFLHEKQKWSEL